MLDGGDDTCTEGDEWEDSNSDMMGANMGQNSIRALRFIAEQPVSVQNTFDELESEDEDLLEVDEEDIIKANAEMVQAFSGWIKPKTARAEVYFSAVREAA